MSTNTRVMRMADPKTPEYEIDDMSKDTVPLLTTQSPNAVAATPLLSPTPRRVGLAAVPNSVPISRSSSAASTSSNRGILRRIFIDRVGTPSQHLLRPTFPPPNLTTYSPVPHTRMTATDHVKLAYRQLFSFIISTVFLGGVVCWALAVEAVSMVPKLLWRERTKQYPWDDDKYWRKQGHKISKEPADYARQIGMDIEHQTVETEDGFFLK